MACLFGRNLIHLHRPDGDDRDDDLNGEFWRRHRHMDNILLNIALSLPPHFRLPGGIADPNIVFTNMNIHTSTICLHQAAIFKADKNRMPATVSAESKIRCITAAAEIASIMRMVCHLDLSGVSSFLFSPPFPGELSSSRAYYGGTLDESVHFLLLVRCSSSIRPISQVQTFR